MGQYLSFMDCYQRKKLIIEGVHFNREKIRDCIPMSNNLTGIVYDYLHDPTEYYRIKIDEKNPYLYGHHNLNEIALILLNKP